MSVFEVTVMENAAYDFAPPESSGLVGKRDGPLKKTWAAGLPSPPQEKRKQTETIGAKTPKRDNGLLFHTA